MDNLPTLLIDTREQTPLDFGPDVATETTGLTAGDYSLSGLRELVAIERKALPDLVSCCCNSERDRFKRELHRLQGYRCRAVIIEAAFRDAENGEYRSNLHPNALLASVASWQVRYNTPFVWANDAEGAARITLELLRQFYRQCMEFVKTIQSEVTA